MRKETIADRLEKYRRENDIKTKKEMAERIGAREREYQYVECDTKWKREPTKEFLKKLVAYTGMSEAYWQYGIVEETRIEYRSEFKSIENTVKELIEDGYIKNVNFSKDIETMLLTALKADISHLLWRKENKK